MRELKEENGEYKLVGNALPAEPVPKNIGFLKEVVKEKASCNRLLTLTVCHLTEGTWEEEKKMSAALRPSTELLTGILYHSNMVSCTLHFKFQVSLRTARFDTHSQGWLADDAFT